METSKGERAPLKVRKDRTDRPVKSKTPDLQSRQSANSKGQEPAPKNFKYKVEYAANSEEKVWLLVKELNALDEAYALMKAKNVMLRFNTPLFVFRIWDNVKNEPVEG